MKKGKVIYYFNITDRPKTSADVLQMSTVWTDKIKNFMGDSYDVLVIPVTDRISEVVVVVPPQYDVADDEKKLLTEEPKVPMQKKPATEKKVDAA